MRKVLLLVLAVVGLTACGKESSEVVTSEATEAAKPKVEVEQEAETQDDEENYETGDATKDDPRNQDDIGEKEILVVSFGTSYNDARVENIKSIEDTIAKEFPDYSVRRAFTSQIIIDHVKDRDGEVIDNVKEALDRAVSNNVTELIVQPTHLMAGYEYNDLAEELAEYSEVIPTIKLGEPLLTSAEDKDSIIKILISMTDGYDDTKALVLMGHGTSAESNSIYQEMQNLLNNKGCKNVIVGTVEADPSIDDVLAGLKNGGFKSCEMRPLMVVAGDHANNDMAGDEEDSWKSIVTKEGYGVECTLKGLGSIPEVQNLYAQHVKDAINK